MSNSTLREILISDFQKLFASVNKIFILVERYDDDTRSLLHRTHAR